jgi:hypothetical protein
VKKTLDAGVRVYSSYVHDANQFSPGLTLPSFTPLAGTLNSDVPPMTDAQIALADMHLRQLAQMRDVGMRMVANAEADMPDDMKPPSKNAMMSAYAQLTKAIRQIMALEEEIIGLREKRAAHLRFAWKKEKTQAVRRSVDSWPPPSRRCSASLASGC